MLRRILNFYRRLKRNRFIKKNKDKIKIDDNAILLDSASFDFRVERKCEAVTIKENSMVGCNFIFESEQGFIEIGKGTFINGGTNLISRSKIKIGDDVTIGWGCYLYDHNSHSLNWRYRCEDIQSQIKDYREKNNFIKSKNWAVVESDEIIIENKVWIGFDVLILKGVTVGEGAIIGAKSVVTKDVEPWTVVAGNPAKFIKKLYKDE